MSKEQSLILEGILIEVATCNGWCINEQGSGGKWSIYKKQSESEYKKVWYYKNREKTLERVKLYQQSEKGKEIHKQAKCKYESKKENKIYKRVASFNHYHPDKIKETPLEAKQKYLQWGYIPDYIKSDDLFNQNQLQ